MAKYKKRKSGNGFVWFVLISVIIGGFYYLMESANQASSDKFLNNDDTELSILDSDFSVHMPELGNKFSGDCTLIKSGDTEILIDAGSKTSSIDTVTEYIDRYCTDKVLEYVIVTHAHEDHYACFTIENGSIFDLYECKNIIDFSQIERGKEDQKMYKSYLSELNDEIENGAKHYTASECIENENFLFEISDHLSLEILDSYYYYNRSSSENNHSVCCVITYNDGDDYKKFLFTGDLEESGEKKLIDLNPDLKDVFFYKAGHHGSSTSSCVEFLEVIRPKMVFVSCVAGSSEYSSNNESQFPTQEFTDNILNFTDKIYITSLSIDYKKGEISSYNGDLVLCYFKSENAYSVICSDNDTIYINSKWFKDNREKHSK